MKLKALSVLTPLLAGALSLPGGGAWATQSVAINSLSFAATLSTPFGGGDTLLLDTLITDGSTGPLSQVVTFTIAPGVTGAIGEATWLVSTPTEGPRLIGVNIDVLNSSNAIVFTDTNTTVINRVATSVLDSVDSVSGLAVPLPAGTYKLVAVGNAIRDVSFDITLRFDGLASPAPEPGIIAMLAAGLGAMAWVLKRRRTG